MSAFGPDMRSRSFYETRQAGSARSNVFRCRGRAWSYRHSSLDAPTENSGTTTAGDAFDFGNTPANLASGETLTQSNGASITDAEEPALSHSRTASVSIGGPGAENFVFAPGIGAVTIVNFNPQQDSIESIQELQSLLTNDGHGDAVIDLGHNDSLTLQGVTTQQLQQVIQQGHVFLH